MPCPLFTEVSWLWPEHYECYPAPVPHGPSQRERIPLHAFGIGGHRYQYVPRTSSDERCHFEAVYGAGDQYLVNKVLPAWDTVTRNARGDWEAEHYERHYGMGPENAGYGGDSTTSMLAVAQIPLSSRRTSAYAQTPAENAKIQPSRRTITRTCWQPDDIEQITWHQQTKWATTRRWTLRDASTSRSASPTPDNSREPA